MTGPLLADLQALRSNSSGEPPAARLGLLSTETPRIEPLELARMTARIAEGKKGVDISIREVGALVGYADYFVFVTGSSRRQVQAIADEIESEMRERGGALRTEGYPSGWWVLLDHGSVVVHVLQGEARAYYDLDHLWADAPSVSVEPPKPALRDVRAAR